MQNWNLTGLCIGGASVWKGKFGAYCSRVFKFLLLGAVKTFSALKCVSTIENVDMEQQKINLIKVVPVIEWASDVQWNWSLIDNT